MSPTKNYVVGFLFTEDRQRVVLVEKLKPDWQKGQFNGVGGKIEEGEEPEDAMAREFAEEAGVGVLPDEWDHFLTLHNDWFACHFYRAFSELAHHTRTVETETIVCVNVQLALAGLPVLPNLRWLIPMALDAGLHIGDGNVLRIKDGKPEG